MQQVNLFQPAFSTQMALGPDLMLRITLALSGALVVATVWAAGSAWWSSMAVGRLEGQVSAEITAVAVLAQQLEKHLDASALEQRAAGLDSERQAKLQLLRRLRDSQVSNVEGFSPHMLGFARQHVEGLWLTGFALEAGGDVVTLEGRALRAELVPRFIGQLGGEDSYRGMQFRSFDVQRTEDGSAP